MHRSIRVSRKWLVLLAALAGLSGCSGDADAAEAAAASVEAAPTVTVASPTVTVSAPTATAVPAEPTEQPTEAPQRPTPQVVDDMALILQELTPNVGHLDYPDSGAVQSAFEADMLYTIVEYLNASMAATEAGVQLGEIPSFVRLAESGRINADLAAELSPSTTELAVFSDESRLVSFWFEYREAEIDLHLCSHIAGVTEGEDVRVTSDRAFRFNTATNPFENVGVSTTPVDLEEFVRCPAHPEE